jgi:hypothetical protein
MCWPFEKALPCAVDQDPQRNELYPLVDSLPTLIGLPAFATLMGLNIAGPTNRRLGHTPGTSGSFGATKCFKRPINSSQEDPLLSPFTMIQSFGPIARAW